MIYTIEGNTLLFAINRTEIMDISENDTIRITGIADFEYQWTDHDREFLENNPDDDIFLRVEKKGNSFQVTGMQLREHEKQY
jgi:hypothetical protein